MMPQNGMQYGGMGGQGRQMPPGYGNGQQASGQGIPGQQSQMQN
jgi:hypothetical protein